MSLSDHERHAILDNQVREWTFELKRLASQISSEKGVNCAVAVISGSNEDYSDGAPELILEDALRVGSHGWPAGFEIELLNPSI